MAKQEKLLVVKERYLAITGYDLVKATVLSHIAAAQQITPDGYLHRSLEQWLLELPVGVSERTLYRKLKELESDGLLERDPDSRPPGVRLTTLVGELVAKLDMDLVQGVLVEADRLVPIRENAALSGTKVLHLSDLAVDKLTNCQDSMTDCQDKLTNCQDSGELAADKLTNCQDNDLAQNLPYTKHTPRVSKPRDKSKKKPRNTPKVPKTEDTQVDPKLTYTSVVKNNSAENEKAPRKRSSRNKYYDWSHYAKYSQEDWKTAKETGVAPGKESLHTLLLGAYLLGLKKQRDIVVGLTPGDFNGKFGTLAKAMLDFFTFKNSGDVILGFNEALSWIKEFLAMPPESFAGQQSWKLDIAFSRNQYRYHGIEAPKTGKKANDTGIVLLTPEQQQEARNRARRVVDGRLQ